MVTSAYPSYSSCRQYRENLYDATRGLDLEVDRIAHYATSPGFVTASVDATLAALEELPTDGEPAQLLFVTHSIPTAMAESAGPEPRAPEGAYVEWHEQVAAEVTRQVSARRGIDYRSDLVYCSRSGPPSQPWLEPDVNDRLTELAAEGVTAVVAVPIGFISDHMEVIFDLDTEAAQTAADLGLAWSRAATAGVHHAFVSELADRMAARAVAGARRGCRRSRRKRASPSAGRACQPECCHQPARTGPAHPVLGRTSLGLIQLGLIEAVLAHSPYTRTAIGNFRRPSRVDETRKSRSRPLRVCSCGMNARDSAKKILGHEPWKGKMATDYDAPRKTDEEMNEDSIEELKTRRNDKNSGKVDEDEAEAAEAFELPGADLSHEELTVRVLPRQSDEFTCAGCFLVRHRSQIAEERANGNAYCFDCAG